MTRKLSRREVIVGAAALTAQAAALGASRRSLAAGTGQADMHPFVDILRPPDSVHVFTEQTDHDLAESSAGTWKWQDVTLFTTPGREGVAVALSAPQSAVRRLRLRWKCPLPTDLLVLGDDWERSYGDLEWRGIRPERPLPWYCATHSGGLTHAYGVRTRPAALCFWQVDSAGVTVWLDLRSGGKGVNLASRKLNVCEIVSRRGTAGESAFAAMAAFCRAMCPAPRLPAGPVYGHNDWYSMYGSATQQTTLSAAWRTVAASPDGPNRPYIVVDGGWSPDETGVWDHGGKNFADIEGLPAQIRGIGGRAGIWIRPLAAPTQTPTADRLARDNGILDPTVPENLAKVSADMARIRGWGYELIKHDYSTFDILGRWGFQMGPDVTDDGWSFAEGSARTTAEVISAFYETIRSAVGDGLVLGCNTIGHLSAGLFELARIGDDTSGRDWERTRRMGVNTLAFRGVQHDTFHAVDPDAIGLNADIPWELDRQWLDLLARSGATLFVSLPADPIPLDQQQALSAAFALAAKPQPIGQATDWLTTSSPEHWTFASGSGDYDWIEPGGASPFRV